LCEALGGHIDVESTPGKGSTFSFTLAQASAAEQPILTTPTPPA
jgi:signal transduction histidine kinase